MLEDKVIQIQKTTVAQNILQQLIDLIMNGTLAPGEKLPSEKQLMELFKAGRSSLREAIRALIALGLVEVRVPEGTFVSATLGGFFTKHLALMSKISFDNITELIEARIKIETDLAELAAIKASGEDIERLNRLVESMREAGENEQFLNADLEFHMTLASIARNSFLEQVLNILRDITKTWILKVIQSDSSKRLALGQHERIAEAIAAHDPQAAAAAMAAHLESVSSLLLDIQKEEQSEEKS